MSRVCVNHADRVPRFFTSTTAAEGPINAAVELHSVLPELHICVDTTCIPHMSLAPCPPETNTSHLYFMLCLWNATSGTGETCKDVQDISHIDTDLNTRGKHSSSYEGACRAGTITEVTLLHLTCCARERSKHCDALLHGAHKSVVRTTPGEFACTANCRAWVSVTAPPPSMIDTVQFTCGSSSLESTASCSAYVRMLPCTFRRLSASN